jgi:hypothetical protein
MCELWRETVLKVPIFIFFVVLVGFKINLLFILNFCWSKILKN